MSMISDITIGQYYKGDSFVHKLDPRAKIILTVLFVAMIFLCKNFFSLALVLGFILLSVAVSKVPFKMFLKSLRPIVPIVLFTAIINIFYITGGKEYIYYGLGLEYFPLKENKSIRLHAAWASNNYTNRHFFNVGLTWKFDVVGAVRFLARKAK